MRQAKYADAEQLNQRSLNSAESDGQRSYTYTMMGMVAQAQGDWVGARSAYERALDLARAAGIEGAEGRALGRLADTYLHDGNASYAAHLLRDALTKLSNSGDVEPSSYITGLMGLAMIQNGQEAEGQQLLDRARASPSSWAIAAISATGRCCSVIARWTKAVTRTHMPTTARFCACSSRKPPIKNT